MSTIHERLDEQRHKARINLSRRPGPGLGLIILRSSGVFYIHETGGYACHHERAQGVFAPLHRPPDDDQEGLLVAHFTGPKWEGWCDDGIDEATADYVDYVLSLSPETDYLKVDRTRLDDSKEAWIYVNVHEPGHEFALSPVSGFGECKGVFIWGNSD
ncbi:MAG TPA: DUF6210 family protein [Pyrinomonadaceae bacterium]